MTEENTNIARELVDIRAYSMRSNLIFYNIPETLHENPEQVVASVLTKMEIPRASEIEIERAHRLGKPRQSHGNTEDTTKPRPLIAKFLRYHDKENISKSAYKLSGTNIGIGEQFPKPIHEARKQLYPIMKRAKQEGHKASLVKDKLYINGQLYKE